MTDHNTYGLLSDFRDKVSPELPFNHMKVRLIVTRDLVITNAEAITIAGPYAVYPLANDLFANLLGIQIGPGWRRRVSAAIGGRHSCTHITELVGPAANITYQTRYGEESRRKRRPRDNSKSGSDNSNDADSRHPHSHPLANSCVAYSVDKT